MKKETLFPFIGLFIIIMLLSCNNDSDIQKEVNINKVDSNFISLETAKSIAANYEFTNVKTRSKVGKKNIENIYSLKKKSDMPEMYIVNYEGGGFVIISADRRVCEILAYSKDNSFPIDGNVVMPEGLENWMHNYVSLVDSVRRNNVKELPKHYRANTRGGDIPLGTWGASREGQSSVYLCYDDGQELEPYFYWVPGIIHVNWGQGVGYNDLLEDKGCGNYSNHKPPVGCVAVAMGAIMRSYEKPISFNWKSMPNSTGAYATQVLMKDIGQKVKMKYDCSGSGAFDSDALYAFKQYYGYTNAKYINEGANGMNIWDQIIYGSPTYAAGSSADRGRHAFVIHGMEFKQIFRCIMDWEADRMYTNYYLKDIYYEINWGYDGYYNGLYMKGNFSPYAGKNYNKDMVFISNFGPLSTSVN